MGNTALIFSNKSHGLEKTLYRKKYSLHTLYIYTYYTLYIHDVTCNLNRWNKGGNGIYTKDQ